MNEKKGFTMPAKVWEHSVWVEETDPLKLQEIIGKMLNDAGFGVLNYTEHHFKPQGFTCVWILAESHLALHTFPEHGKTYLQLSSCMLPYFNNFLNLLNEKWQ